ncbi:MAG: aryl-sulfate sulfotransferase [Caldilineaceae bacterium]|nr:aryl-sulfate sulfotransferase [Caldilineaceae bacterium]
MNLSVNSVMNRVLSLADRFDTENLRTDIIVYWIVVFFSLAMWSTPLQAQSSSPFNYISPQPDATLVSPFTTIALRSGDVIDPHSISPNLFVVEGDVSGPIPGTVQLARDNKTVIFKPGRPFTPGESVNVTVQSGLVTSVGNQLGGVSFSFTVSAKPLPEAQGVSSAQLWSNAVPTFSVSPQETVTRTQPYLTVPNDFPAINVTVPANGTDDGYLFMSNYSFVTDLGVQPYLLILDNAGEPVFYKRMTPGKIVLDFKKQPNGLLTFYDVGVGHFQAMDNTYAIVDTYTTGNGYGADHHDLQILPNGNYLLMAWDYQPIDMSQIVAGGDPNATVVGLIVQELDPDHNVVFEWRSWDHFEITESSADLTEPIIFYTHGNAVEEDADGNLLVSSRVMNEITKIDRQTADVIWRLGGKKNEFSFLNDDKLFYRQHDIRRLPNGHITLFDNREGETPVYSRVVEYELDEVNKTAKVVWQYRNTPDTYGPYLANAQRLPNGNTLIGWGHAVPTLTEVKPDGSKAFELSLKWPSVSYRAFRFPWQGAPTWPPVLAAATDGITTTLHMSWNGATDVAAYEIHAGNSISSTKLIRTQPKSGFETTVDVTADVGPYCLFRVRPVDSNGQQKQFSNLLAFATPQCKQLYLPLATQN